MASNILPKTEIKKLMKLGNAEKHTADAVDMTCEATAQVMRKLLEDALEVSRGRNKAGKDLTIEDLAAVIYSDDKKHLHFLQEIIDREGKGTIKSE